MELFCCELSRGAYCYQTYGQDCVSFCLQWVKQKLKKMNIPTAHKTEYVHLFMCCLTHTNFFLYLAMHANRQNLRAAQQVTGDTDTEYRHISRVQRRVAPARGHGETSVAKDMMQMYDSGTLFTYSGYKTGQELKDPHTATSPLVAGQAAGSSSGASSGSSGSSSSRQIILID